MSYVQHPNHIQFILKPASSILQEAISSLNATSGGIETYPICSYVMHSLFLKLTGAQEQKLKCICWELACRDYEYRHERFERNRFSECSDYSDKNMVFSDLLDAIDGYDKDVITEAFKDQILKDWRQSMDRVLDSSLLAKAFRNRYTEYKTIIAGVNKAYIMSGNQLLTNKANLSSTILINTCGLGLQELFKEYVFKERNRCAHNTRSYQHNIPSLKNIAKAEYKLQNYFLYMAVIVLLDEIYVKMFKIYLDKCRITN